MKNLSILTFLFGLFLSLSLQAQNWIQIGNDINGEAAGDQTGHFVSLSEDGSIVAIGAPFNDGNGDNSGHVRIYQNINDTWTQIGDDIDGESSGDCSGNSVSLSGNGLVVAIGSPFSDEGALGAGHVRVYENVGGNWTQIGNNILGEDSQNGSGNSVSLSADGSIVAIGAPFNNGNGYKAGHVRIYENFNGTWTQIGNDIDGETEGDESGYSVCLSANGSVVAIGAMHNNQNGSDAGHVRIYENINGNWTQIGNDIDGESSGDRSGNSVSLSADGSIVAIGAYLNDGNGNNSGHVRVYQNISGTWTQIGNDIDGEAMHDWSGGSVSLSTDGSIVAIGARGNDGNGGSTGHVRIYQNINGNWTQIGNDIDGEAIGDGSGFSVSLSSDGSMVAIGAYANDNNGDNAGQVRVYRSPDSSIENLQENGFTVYPNPTKDIVNLTFYNNKIKELDIIDATGKSIFVKTNIPKNEVIDLSDFSNGIYLIKAVTNKHKTFTKKIVKE